MSKYFCKPEAQTVHELTQAVRQWHEELEKIGLTFSVLMVHETKNLDADEILIPALKHHGIAAYAKVRAMPLSLRAHGLGDVELLIDGDRWKRIGVSTRYAILDHELTHVDLVHDDHGRLQRDDCGRPKVTMRQHDFQVGWFFEIAERHKRASVEVQQAHQLRDLAGQSLFDFPEVAS